MNILGAPVTDASAWVAADYRQDRSWLYELTGDDLAELDAALDAVKARGLAPPHFGHGEFRIPRFSTKIRQVIDEINHGRGFFVIRGIPVDRYPLDDIKAMYWGHPALFDRRGGSTSC